MYIVNEFYYKNPLPMIFFYKNSFLLGFLQQNALPMIFNLKMNDQSFLQYKCFINDFYH